METEPETASPPDLPPVIARVLAFIRAGGGEAFDALAREVFAFQFQRNAPYRRLCERRGVCPKNVGGWASIPAVPTDAFKHARLTCGSSRRIFRTSGTTEGLRGEHHLPSLDLYRASWEEPFRRHLVPNRERLPVLSLIPAEAEAPESSLAFMAARVRERFDDGTGGVYLGDDGLATDRLLGRLDEAVGSGRPVLILATAFAMVHLLDLLDAEASRVALPAGSRIMDTGGFKGRSREVSRKELLRGYAERLGVPPTHVVGEYGMTEMCSQFYEPPLGKGDAAAVRIMTGPCWVRTRVLDPETLAERPEGEVGLLAHVDLANAWTVSSLVTGDLGVRRGNGFVVLGRAPGASLRGCSLATEELLEGP